jgi:cupin superfamily acireductone dioxygenase involved in methionine salvage
MAAFAELISLTESSQVWDLFVSNHQMSQQEMFLEVDGDGFARVGDEEFKIESQTSVIVPPVTVHAFGLRHGNILKSVSIPPDADAVPGHRVTENGETFGMPEAKKKSCEAPLTRVSAVGVSKIQINRNINP